MKLTPRLERQPLLPGTLVSDAALWMSREMWLQRKVVRRRS